MALINVKQLKCQKCRHTWIPRKKEIRICPKCKTAYWDKPLSERNK